MGESEINQAHRRRLRCSLCCRLWLGDLFLDCAPAGCRCLASGQRPASAPARAWRGLCRVTGPENAGGGSVVDSMVTDGRSRG